MKIQAFIFNWVGYEANAAALEQSLSSVGTVHVINSDSTVECRHPGWHHLGDEAYFAAQWNKALELFDGDVLFHIQADASFTQFAELFERCRFAVDHCGCGVYAPNVDFTFWNYDRNRLRPIDADLFEVPQTDCTCWAVAREVLQRVPRVDPRINKIGWGLDWMVVAAARTIQKKVARDYRFTVAHPKKTGYKIGQAQRDMAAMLETAPPQARSALRKLRKEALSKLPRPPHPTLQKALGFVKPWAGRLFDTFHKP
jgi:hypothetical protein